MNLGCIIYPFFDRDERTSTGPKSMELSNQILDIVDSNLCDNLTIVTGLNAGPDNTIAYGAIINHLPLSVILPYTYYTTGWNEVDKRTYDEILTYKNKKVRYINVYNLFRKELEGIRNCAIIDESDTIILYGQSDLIIEAQTYAKMKRKEILTLKTSSNEKATSKIY